MTLTAGLFITYLKVTRVSKRPASASRSLWPSVPAPPGTKTLAALSSALRARTGNSFVHLDDLRLDHRHVKAFVGQARVGLRGAINEFVIGQREPERGGDRRLVLRRDEQYRLPLAEPLVSATRVRLHGERSHD